MHESIHMIALMQAYKSNLLTYKNIYKNIIAGIIVGIVALPLSLAFAIASNVAPITGIYTAIIAAFIVGIFGGTQVQISGPTGAFAIVLSHIVAQHGFIGLQCATLLAGLLLFIMGFSKIGSYIKFIPYSVVIGFTTGIGFIIFVNQIKNFLGLSIIIPSDTDIIHKLLILTKNLYLYNSSITLFSIYCLIIYSTSQRYIKKIPAPLITLSIATITYLLLGIETIPTINSEFHISFTQWPILDFSTCFTINWSSLVIPACNIALLCAIESLLSAAAIDTINNSKHNPNQELIGQGMANIITPIFGGFASTGAIARTIINIRNGGNSPIAAITHSFTLLFILYWFIPYIAYIPLSAFSIILIFVAYHMADLPLFIHIAQKAPWYDKIVLILTCGITVIFDLNLAVIIGITCSFLLLLIRLQQTSKGYLQYFVKQIKKQNHITNISKTISDKTIRFTVHGPIFFIVTPMIEEALIDTHTAPQHIIFDFKEVPFIDITGLTILYKILQQYHQKNIKISFEHVSSNILKKIRNIHLDQFIDNIS
jgi:sulfate permease, SulP family